MRWGRCEVEGDCVYDWKESGDPGIDGDEIGEKEEVG